MVVVVVVVVGGGGRGLGFGCGDEQKEAFEGSLVTQKFERQRISTNRTGKEQQQLFFLAGQKR